MIVRATKQVKLRGIFPRGNYFLNAGMAIPALLNFSSVSCSLKPKCTTGKQRRMGRWEHEAVLEAMEDRVDRKPDCMRIRGSTVEHPFGTIKSWLGPTHFQMRRLEHVSTEMSLHVLSYNLKRMLQMFGVAPLMAAIRG